MTQVQARGRSQVEFDVNKLFESLEGESAHNIRDRVFQAATRVHPTDLEGIMLRRRPVPEGASALSIVRNLGELLALRSSDVAELLGVSQSRVSRNDAVSLPILDRAYGISGLFAQVSVVLGPENARQWFGQPTPGLDGEVPYRLLDTGFGGEKIEGLVRALLHGAVI